MKVAAIGIGSNSLRMLVAEIHNKQIVNPKRYRKGMRVFAALDAHKNISPAMIHEACASVMEFKRQAISEGAAMIHLFATSAVRDAANQSVFAEALRRETGLSLEVCTGDEEASLSFWGAACAANTTGMIDIGGGSTEIAIGSDRVVRESISLQLGAVRLYKMKPIVSADDAEEVVQIVSDALTSICDRFSSAREKMEWFGVGGTFTACAAIIQRIPWEQRKHIHGFVITVQMLKEAIEFIAPMPVEQRLKLNCLQPQRADIVVHGMAILKACMEKLNIPAIRVSEHGNMEGYLKSKYIFEKI